MTDPSSISDLVIKTLGEKAALKWAEDEGFSAYQKDPVGFCEKFFGETYTDDVKRMMESVRDYEITIAMSANSTGKTHGAARVSAWFYLCFPESQVITAAAPPENNLRRILWGEIGSITLKHPDLFKEDQLNVMHIHRSPRHFLTGATIPVSGDPKTIEARFSGKHPPNLLFVFDEGDAIPDPVYAGREACSSGGFFRTLIMLNPRQMKGAVYRMFRDNRANVVHLSAFNHPNVMTGKEVIPSAVDRNTTCRRIAQMCRLMTEDEREDTLDTFILPDFLVGYQPIDQKKIKLPPLRAGRYKVMEPSFCHMVLGQYPAQAPNQLISMEWITAARMRWDMWVARYGEVAPDVIKGIAGLDVGELGNDPSEWCVRYGGWLSRFKHWTGVDTNYTSDRAIEHAAKERLECTMVDGNGVGAGVAPNMMRKGVAARGVKTQESPDDREAEPEFGQFKILRDQLAWQVREWLRTDPNSMLPPDEELIEELSVPTYQPDGKYVRVMQADVLRDILKRSPNKFSALCLTFAKPLDIGGVSTADSRAEHKRLRQKYSRYGRK